MVHASQIAIAESPPSDGCGCGVGERFFRRRRRGVSDLRLRSAAEGPDSADVVRDAVAAGLRGGGDAQLNDGGG